MGLFTNLLRREEAVFAPESEYAAWIFARLGSWPSACTFDYAFLSSITGFPACLNILNLIKVDSMPSRLAFLVTLTRILFTLRLSVSVCLR